MSIRYEIRLCAMEKKVAELEERLLQLEHPPDVSNGTDADETTAYVKRGFQGFFVYQGDEKVSDRPLKQDEAQQMADEMNGALDNIT